MSLLKPQQAGNQQVNEGPCCRILSNSFTGSLAFRLDIRFPGKDKQMMVPVQAFTKY